MFANKNRILLHIGADWKRVFNYLHSFEDVRMRVTDGCRWIGEIVHTRKEAGIFSTVHLDECQSAGIYEGKRRCGPIRKHASFARSWLADRETQAPGVYRRYKDVGRKKRPDKQCQRRDPCHGTVPSCKPC